MSPRRYPSDLRDREWALLAALLPVSAGYGRPRLVDLRGVINGILYVLWTGCQWRALPSEYPHWNTVYGYFRRWRQDGTWEWLHDQLRRQVRVASGRSPEPSAGSVDSQSVPTAERGAPRLRWRQARPRPQAAHPGRYPGSAVGRAGDPGQRAGQDGAALAAGGVGTVPPSSSAAVGRRRLPE